MVTRGKIESDANKIWSVGSCGSGAGILVHSCPNRGKRERDSRL